MEILRTTRLSAIREVTLAAGEDGYVVWEKVRKLAGEYQDSAKGDTPVAACVALGVQLGRDPSEWLAALKIRRP